MAEGKIGIGGSFYGFLFRGSIIFCVLMAGLFSFDNSEAGYYSWTNEGGPYGGRIQTAAFLNNSTILAGSRHGGIYVSHDTGNSWTVVNQGLTNYIINDLAGNPANSNTVYAATGGGGRSALVLPFATPVSPAPTLRPAPARSTNVFYDSPVFFLSSFHHVSCLFSGHPMIIPPHAHGVKSRDGFDRHAGACYTFF